MPRKRVLGGPIRPVPVVVAQQPAESLPLSPTPEPDVIESIEISVTPTNQSKDTTESDLLCPICNETMVSLAQLNRHLDDEHGFGGAGGAVSPPNTGSPKAPVIQLNGSPSFINSLGAPQNEELRSWLRKTNEVKTKLQATLPRKFVKLDIFDTGNGNGNGNGNGTLTPDSRNSSSTSVSAQSEIQVTRKHWQKPQAHDSCSFPGCKKHLSIKNGVVNCRRCGHLFCHQHTNFRVKLDAEAHYDHHGVWCRCCETCYKEKPGYNDHGAMRDMTQSFKEHRQRQVDERQLYENKLEKRVIKLTAMLNKVDREYHSSELNNNFLSFKINSKRREVEQRLVNWEDGAHVLNCFICLRNYSFTLRKHHCRLCGRVVCGDAESACSMEVPINHLTTLLDVPRVNDSTTIRMCRHCKDVLFLKRNFQLDLKKPLSPLLEKFETQQNVKRTILVLMPRFEDILQRLQADASKSPQDASKLRKRLVDAFALFDKLTKEIVSLQCNSRDEQLLQMGIKTESAAFIQQNMAPLKQLPKLMEKIEHEAKKKENVPKFTREEVHKIKRDRDELMVLQEQKYLVGEMIESCKKQRRFDEIAALDENLKELEQNIKELQIGLGDEGF